MVNRPLAQAGDLALQVWRANMTKYFLLMADHPPRWDSDLTIQVYSVNMKKVNV